MPSPRPQAQYSLNQLDRFPLLYSYTGKHVDVHVLSDSGTDVLALRVRETMYSSDLYSNSDHEYWSVAGSGIAIILLSALTPGRDRMVGLLVSQA